MPAGQSSQSVSSRVSERSCLRRRSAIEGTPDINLRVHVNSHPRLHPEMPKHAHLIPTSIKQTKRCYVLPTSNSFSFSFSLNLTSKSCKYWQCSDCRSSCNFLTAAWCWVSRFFRETREQHRGKLAYDETGLASPAALLNGISYQSHNSHAEHCAHHIPSWAPGGVWTGVYTNGKNGEAKLSRLHLNITAGAKLFLPWREER